MKIKREELIEQIKCVVKDEFIANVSAIDGQIVLHFVNGQKFSIDVKEI
jgi:hypothetical protein